MQIDLSRYVTSYSGWRRTGVAIRKFSLGQQAARETNIKNFVGEEVLLVGPVADLVLVDEKFLSGLLRPLVTRQGIDETVRLVSGSGGPLVSGLRDFRESELLREQKKKAKDEKEASKGDWSECMRFLVPTKGTELKLMEDWKFRLHDGSRGRNRAFMDVMGLEWSRSGMPECGPYDVILKKGTLLKVDRIYIRQAKSFDSLTFNIQKRQTSVAVYNDKEHVFKEKGVRFWAKLSDVNKMLVRIDCATLAEN